MKYADPTKAINEMHRVAVNAVAVIEVVAPSELALRFAQNILCRKEPSRNPSSIYTDSALVALAGGVGGRTRALHFEQYIDVEIWLRHTDIESDQADELYHFIKEQPIAVKQDQQIHLRSGRLMMLRRMALVICEKHLPW